MEFLLSHAIAGELWRFTHIFTTLIFNNGVHGNAKACRLTRSYSMKTSMSKNTQHKLAFTGLLTILLSACGGGTSTTTTTDSGSNTSTSTASVLCDYASNLFNSSPSVNATATARWSCSSTQRSIVANGLPDHAVGNFPNNDNPNTIAAQNIAASVSLTPHSDDGDHAALWPPEQARHCIEWRRL